jgi:hypothetical protein
MEPGGVWGRLSRAGRLVLDSLKLLALSVLMSLVVGGGLSIFFACPRSLMLWLSESYAPPFKGSGNSLSGLVFGLLSDLDGINFSFKRLAGESPRKELEILFRLVDLSVEGSLNVSALSSKSVVGSTGVDSDTRSD